jgi:WD40 repeat protein
MDAIKVYEGTIDAVNSLEVLGDAFYVGSFQGVINGYQIESRSLFQSLVGHEKSVTGMLSYDKLNLVSCSRDGTVRTWNLEDGVERGRIQSRVEDEIHCMCRNENTIYAGTGSGHLLEFDLVEGICLSRRKIHDTVLSCLSFGQGLVVTGSWDRLAKAIDPKTGDEVAVYDSAKNPFGGNHRITSVTMGRDWLYCGSADSRIRLYDVGSARCLHELSDHTGAILSMKVHGDNMFSAGNDMVIRQWDTGTMTCQHVFRGHKDAVRCLAISEGGVMFSGSFDRTVRSWNLQGVRNYINMLEDARKERERSDMKEHVDRGGKKKGKGKGGAKGKDGKTKGKGKGKGKKK